MIQPCQSGAQLRVIVPKADSTALLDRSAAEWQEDSEIVQPSSQHVYRALVRIQLYCVSTTTINRLL